MAAELSTLERECPVCKHNRFRFWFQPVRSPGPIVQCFECGFVWANPIETTRALIFDGPVIGDYPDNLLESSNVDAINGGWEQPIIDGYLNELPAKEVNARATLKHIQKYVRRRGTLLDVGCFCGVFLNVAAQAGWDTYGVEPLVMPAVYARGHFGLRVVTDTLRENLFPPEYFDVVTSFQVFEHLVDPEKELIAIRNILKPGGILVIEVPNIETVMVKIFRSRHRHFVEDHVSFFSARTLSQLLSRSDFRVREVFYPGRYLSLNNFLWWLERYSKKITCVNHMLPKRFLAKQLHINFRDIITVIAEKGSSQAV